MLPVVFARIEWGEGAAGDALAWPRDRVIARLWQILVEASQIDFSQDREFDVAKGKKMCEQYLEESWKGYAVNAETKTPRPIVRTSAGQTDYKRELAYQRLGINPKDVECIPFFATDLRRIARAVRGADKDATPTAPVRALDFIEYSEDPEARKVLEVYRSVPESYRRLLRPEDFCYAAGVSPWRVLECITVSAVRQAAIGSAFVAAVLHPRVVEKTVERALQDDGTRERWMLQKTAGFL